MNHKKAIKKQQKQLADAYAIAAAGGAFGKDKKKYVGESKRNPIWNIDIEKEYKLIQEKKSELSRTLRDYVVYAYENKDEIKKKADEIAKVEAKEQKKKDKENEKLMQKHKRIPEELLTKEG